VTRVCSDQRDQRVADEHAVLADEVRQEVSKQLFSLVFSAVVGLGLGVLIGRAT
jgi:hypothetical protein